MVLSGSGTTLVVQLGGFTLIIFDLFVSLPKFNSYSRLDFSSNLLNVSCCEVYMPRRFGTEEHKVGETMFACHVVYASFGPTRIRVTMAPGVAIASGMRISCGGSKSALKRGLAGGWA